MLRSSKSLRTLWARTLHDRVVDRALSNVAQNVRPSDTDLHLQAAQAHEEQFNHHLPITMMEESDGFAACVVTTPDGPRDISSNLKAAREHAFAMCTGIGGLA